MPGWDPGHVVREAAKNVARGGVTSFRFTRAGLWQLKLKSAYVIMETGLPSYRIHIHRYIDVYCMHM